MGNSSIANKPEELRVALGLALNPRNGKSGLTIPHLEANLFSIRAV
jgi:hypothetical protein